MALVYNVFYMIFVFYTLDCPSNELALDQITD